MDERVRFRFLVDNRREAAELAAQVERQIRSTAAAHSNAQPDIVIEPESPEHQDFGAILAIVLAGPAVVAAAQVFAEWVCDRGYSLEITLPSGAKVALRNASKKMIEDTIRQHATD
jgi:hypothetical protein